MRMTFVRLALVALVGCAALERNFHGDRVNERMLAEARGHARLELQVQPATVRGGGHVTISTALTYDGNAPVDICTESGGVSTWLEGADSKLLFPLHLYGMTTDVQCSRSVHLEPGGVRRLSEDVVIPSRVAGTVNVCAGMAFDYCGVSSFGCAYSTLRSACVPITVEH